METKDKYKHSKIGTFSTRPFDIEKDYDEYKRWLSYFKDASCPDITQLSTEGLIVECEGEKLCAGFLYITNSSISSIEFVVANIKAQREKRKESVKILLTELEELAKRLCYDYIFVTTNNPGFSRTLIDKHGYQAGAKSIEHYKIIKSWQSQQEESQQEPQS